jgi:hypothetical protein
MSQRMSETDLWALQQADESARQAQACMERQCDAFRIAVLSLLQPAAGSSAVQRSQALAEAANAWNGAETACLRAEEHLSDTIARISSRP